MHRAEDAVFKPPVRQMAESLEKFFKLKTKKCYVTSCGTTIIACCVALFIVR